MKKVLYPICFLFIGWLIASYIDTSVHSISDCKEQEATKAEAATKKEKICAPMKKLKAEKVKPPTKHYTKDNVILLAKLIQAENGGAKHDETLYLTGAVVMKRVKAECYPDTIKEVIYQPGQYSTAQKLDSVKPSTRALEIANEVLIHGVDELPDNLVFQSLFFQGRKLYKKIDGEYFCLA